MESSLCWKHLSGCVISRIFPTPYFLLLLPYAFSLTLSCVHILTPVFHALIPSRALLIRCSSLLLDENPEFFMLLFRVHHTKLAFLVHVSCVWCVLSSSFSAFSSLLNPPCSPISHLCVCRGVAAPEQSRLCQLVNGVKERGVEGAA